MKATSGLSRIRKNRSNTRKLFDKVWKKCSEYVRRRDTGRCFTCGNVRDYKEQNAGHFRHGKAKPTFFNENNIRCQCIYCNQHLHGNLGIYALKLLNEIGQEAIDKIILESHQVKKWKLKELEELDIYFTKKLKEL